MENLNYIVNFNKKLKIHILHDNKRKFKCMKKNNEYELDEDKIFPYNKLPRGVEWCSYCLKKINDRNCKFCHLQIHTSYFLYDNYSFHCKCYYEYKQTEYSFYSCTFKYPSSHSKFLLEKIE